MAETIAETRVYGMDLGTTNSCIGIWMDGKVEILSNTLKENTTPSCVAFVNDGILVGNSALAQQNFNPANTIFDAKRTIGQKFEKVNDISKYLPFPILEDTGHRPCYQVMVQDQLKTIWPEQISAIILKQLKADVESTHHEKVNFYEILTVILNISSISSSIFTFKNIFFIQCCVIFN